MTLYERPLTDEINSIRLQETFTQIEDRTDLEPHRRIQAMDIHLGFVLHAMLDTMQTNGRDRNADELWKIANQETAAVDNASNAWWAANKGNVPHGTMQYVLLHYRAIKGGIDRTIERHGDFDVADTIKDLTWREAGWAEYYLSDNPPITLDDIR